MQPMLLGVPASKKHAASDSALVASLHFTCDVAAPACLSTASSVCNTCSKQTTGTTLHWPCDKLRACHPELVANCSLLAGQSIDAAAVVVHQVMIHKVTSTVHYVSSKTRSTPGSSSALPPGSIEPMMLGSRHAQPNTREETKAVWPP
jgi:hypothetical protein